MKVDGFLFVRIYLSAICALFLLISCERELSHAVEPSSPHNGSIFIDSNPTGFKIYIDGKWRGDFTPDTLTFLEHTSHNIKLTKKLFRDSTFGFDLSDMLDKKVKINFLNNPKMLGKVQVFSKPTNSLIIIGDSLTNQYTPAIIDNLVPGKYTIQCMHDGYFPSSANVFVESSFLKNTNIVLEDTSVWVRYDLETSEIPVTNLTCIAIDKNNIIWVGTEAMGLVSFDRKEWKVYNAANSQLPSDYIAEMMFDRDGRLWIINDNGFVIKNKDTWQIFNQANSPLPDIYCTSISIGEQGDAIFGTQKGLVRYYDNKWEIFSKNNSNIPDNRVKKVLIDNTNTNWIATADETLSTFKYSPNNNGADWNITSLHGWFTAIYGASDGEKWFATQEITNAVLYSYDNTGSDFVQRIKIPGTTILKIFVDSKKSIWLATINGFINYEEGPYYSLYNSKNSGIRSNYISDIAQDNEGNLWIASYNGGLVKYKSTSN